MVDSVCWLMMSWCSSVMHRDWGLVMWSNNSVNSCMVRRLVVYRNLSVMNCCLMMNWSGMNNRGFVVNGSLMMNWHFCVMNWCSNMRSFMMHWGSNMWSFVMNWSGDNMRCLVMGSNSLMMSRCFMQLSSDELFV